MPGYFCGVEKLMQGPNLLFVHGQVPGEAPEKTFEADKNEDDFDEFSDGYDSEDYDQLDFDENWN